MIFWLPQAPPSQNLKKNFKKTWTFNYYVTMNRIYFEKKA